MKSDTDLRAKYEGEDPGLIWKAIRLLESSGIEAAVAETGKSREWVEKWASKGLAPDEVMDDALLDDPFYAAFSDLMKKYPGRMPEVLNSLRARPRAIDRMLGREPSTAERHGQPTAHASLESTLVEEWCEIFELEIETSSDILDIFSDPALTSEWYLTGVSARLAIDGAVIGRLNGSLIRADLIVNDGADVLTETLDEVSQEIYDVGEALFCGDYYREEIVEEYRPQGMKVLYLDQMTIEVPFRGHGFGLAILQHTMRAVAHDLVIIKPHPLQYGFNERGVIDSSEFPEFRDIGLEDGKAKLAEYYKRLGFTWLAGTPYMVRSDMWQYEWIRLEVEDETLRGLRAAAARLPLVKKAT